MADTQFRESLRDARAQYPNTFWYITDEGEAAFVWSDTCPHGYHPSIAAARAAFASECVNDHG